MIGTIHRLAIHYPQTNTTLFNCHTVLISLHISGQKSQLKILNKKEDYFLQSVTAAGLTVTTSANLIGNVGIAEQENRKCDPIEEIRPQYWKWNHIWTNVNLQISIGLICLKIYLTYSKLMLLLMSGLSRWIKKQQKEVLFFHQEQEDSDRSKCYFVWRPLCLFCTSLPSYSECRESKERIGDAEEHLGLCLPAMSTDKRKGGPP